MSLDPPSCYRALLARDRRFDGRFFVGVSSTRIYCRPVCTVRPPRRENCTFYATAAAAEAAGFRPCLRCRPELAPGNAAIDATERLAQAAIALIEDGALEHEGIESLARPLGITSRHLRRVFDRAFGVSPVAFAQTHRLLLAKRLLTDTRLPVTDVAYASGFRSLRRFNASFVERYRMAPQRLRREAKAVTDPQPLRFELPYRPPYDWSALLDFLRARAVSRMESIQGDRYVRAVRVQHGGATALGWIAVAPVARRDALALEMSPSLARVVVPVLRRARQAFDTACDPDAVASSLGALAEEAPGMRVPGTMDGFELAVRAVIGQQVSVKAARTFLSRLVAALGEPLSEGHADVDRAFPSAAAVAEAGEAALAAVGLVRARARTLVALAREVAAGRLVLEPHVDVERTTDALRAIPGIGDWTAQIVAMRALAWPDAFPAGDGPLRKVLGERYAAGALARSIAWHPWRSYAVLHLWRLHERGSALPSHVDAARGALPDGA